MKLLSIVCIGREVQMVCPYCGHKYKKGNIFVVNIQSGRIVEYYGEANICCGHVKGLIPKVFSSRNEAEDASIKHCFEHNESAEFLDHDMEHFQKVLLTSDPNVFAELSTIASLFPPS